MFRVEEDAALERPLPVARGALVARGLVGGALLALFAFGVAALLAALKTMRESHAALDFGSAAWNVAHPAQITDWVQLAGILAFGLIGGLFVAAITAARGAPKA